MSLLFKQMTRNSILFTLLILSFIGTCCVAQNQSTLEVTFISNEGFLIKSGNQSVLIDALYKKSHPDFTYPSDGLRNQMVKGDGPFKGIDIYLQSHVHYTHFFPETVGQFLNKNEKSMMIASPQVVDSLTKLSPVYGKVKDQLMIYDWSKEQMSFSHNDISIEAFKINHDGQQQWGWVQNLGHIMRIGSFKVLHMGDLLLDEQVLNKMNLKNENIDLVILPYWVILQNGAEKIKKLINADHYIISHFPIPRVDQNIARIKNAMPDAIIINNPMEQKVFQSKD